MRTIPTVFPTVTMPDFRIPTRSAHLMGRHIHVITDQLAKELALSQRKCRLLVQRLLEEIQNDIVYTGRLEFRGLGTFALAVRPAHTTSHPSTGQPVHIPEKKTIRYRSSKVLRERLNPDLSLLADNLQSESVAGSQAEPTSIG